MTLRARGQPASSQTIVEILRHSLERGRRVEIEGLGAFLREAGRYRFAPQTQPQVFVAYVREDLRLARRLCEGLRDGGCSPWLDKDKLLAGQNWPRAIERAIGISDVFVACFSPRSIARGGAKRGGFQSELRYALRCARRRPPDSVFLVPVRFERCPVPRRISDHVQYVDLFPDWERGIKRVVRAIRKAGRPRLGCSLLEPGV
jgi:hypothetical protein